MGIHLVGDKDPSVKHVRCGTSAGSFVVGVCAVEGSGSGTILSLEIRARPHNGAGSCVTWAYSYAW